MVLFISFISFYFLFIKPFIIDIIITLNLDPLDPLTEIINSGQGFSSSIALEKIDSFIIHKTYSSSSEGCEDVSSAIFLFLE